MKKLNTEELILGAFYPLMFVLWLKWTVLACIPITSFFWALSGSEGQLKLWRRLGCPLVVGTGLFLMNHNIYMIFGVVLSFLVLSIGYGIPSTQPPDAGSILGRFWFKISEKYANVLTRTTIFTLLFFSFGIFLWR